MLRRILSPVKAGLAFFWLIFINLHLNVRVLVTNLLDFLVFLMISILTLMLSVSVLNSQKFDISSLLNVSVAILGTFTALVFTYASVLEKEDPLKSYVVYSGEQFFRATLFLLISGLFNFVDLSIGNQTSLKLFTSNANETFVYLCRIVSKFISVIYVILALNPILSASSYIYTILNFK